MSKFEIGPTGKLIQGHIFDVRRESFETAITGYDRLLYLAWNPYKRRGLGCWEIRRKPEKKTAVYHGDFEGASISTLEDVEADLISHVLDVPFLTYSAIERLQAMDAWNNKNWIDDLEGTELEETERMKREYKKELRYGLQQDRRVFKVFKDMVASGTNPALIAKYWK